VAHQLVCVYVLSTTRPRVDAVWMVPTWKHPFDKQLAPYADRVAMCERAAALLGERVAVSRVEEQLGGESYTLHTVRAIREARPELDLCVVIGSDLYGERTRWFGWPDLEREVPFVVVGRAGDPAASAPAMPDVSSSEVRARLGRGEPVDHLVPADVLEYIHARQLYRPATQMGRP
jgi:nicotinate-nucleotide adenylyltransferase